MKSGQDETRLGQVQIKLDWEKYVIKVELYKVKLAEIRMVKEIKLKVR